MIELSFDIDERTLVEDAREDPDRADAAVLDETYFVMPVRFSVDGVELLSNGQELPCELPLIGFGSSLMSALHGIADGERRHVYLAGGGDLELQRHADEVRISSPLTKKAVSASLEDLLAAARKFVRSVRVVLEQKVPAVTRHPHWAAWFSEA